MGRPRWVKTPHPAKKPTVHACSSCGNRHRAPTGKKCTHDGASTAASDEAVLHHQDLVETQDLGEDLGETHLHLSWNLTKQRLVNWTNFCS